MSWSVLKCKFKERLAIILTGLVFTILLTAETQFLSIITPHKQKDIILNHQRNVSNIQPIERGTDDERKTAKIFEEILQNLDSHIGVMRRELSIVVTNDSEHISENSNTLNSDTNPKTILKYEASDPKLKLAVANSRVVNKYADVIFKIADILYKSKGKGRQYNVEEKTGHTNIQSENQSHNNDNGNKAKEEQVDSINFAWPKLGVYSSNVTISHLAHPNGYMKREGKDFDLPENVVIQLEGYADKLKAIHVPNNKSDWDTLDLYEDNGTLPSWKRWHNSISRYQMYPDDTELINELLYDLKTQPPEECYEKPNAGTQFKLFYHFKDKGRALFKAIRFSREQETLPDHYYFSDFERFNAEIAAYHLDRVLGFHRVPPATGRIIHMKKEMQQVAVDGLDDEIFYSPAGNLCVRGRCEYYCDLHHMICGRPYLLEGVMMAYMPSANDVDRVTWKHPWKRSYIVDTAANWEKNSKHCEKVRRQHPYNEGRRLLDLMDLTVFDFLMNHMDRHHYETFEPFGNDTFMMHLDNGKGFGSHREDEMTNLYPIMHCCLIRYTTYQKLVDFHKGPIHLGEAMRKSMQNDPVAPVLLDPHLKALDRRVKIILEEIQKCTLKKDYEEVIVDDGF